MGKKNYRKDVFLQLCNWHGNKVLYCKKSLQVSEHRQHQWCWVRLVQVYLQVVGGEGTDDLWWDVQAWRARQREAAVQILATHGILHQPVSSQNNRSSLRLQRETLKSLYLGVWNAPLSGLDLGKTHGGTIQGQRPVLQHPCSSTSLRLWVFWTGSETKTSGLWADMNDMASNRAFVSSEPEPQQPEPGELCKWSHRSTLSAFIFSGSHSDKNLGHESLKWLANWENCSP